MNREEAKQMTENALKDLARELEQGHSEQLRAYLDVMARFHRYSFGNVLLIALQKPDASQVAGFHAWRKLGRWVKKGESGIAILAPMVCRRRESVDTPVDRKDSEADRNDRRLAGFRVVHVFDITQTEGTDLPQFARVQGEAGDILVKLKAMVAGHGIRVESTKLPADTHGASTGGRILLRDDLSPAQAVAVLTHEFAHELLHRTERSGSKTTIETEAEAIAYVVCRAVGLDPTTACADYIQLHRGNQATLTACLDIVQQTASGIIIGLQATG